MLALAQVMPHLNVCPNGHELRLDSQSLAESAFQLSKKYMSTSSPYCGNLKDIRLMEYSTNKRAWYRLSLLVTTCWRANLLAAGSATPMMSVSVACLCRLPRGVYLIHSNDTAVMR